MLTQRSNTKSVQFQGRQERGCRMGGMEVSETDQVLEMSLDHVGDEQPGRNGKRALGE